MSSLTIGENQIRRVETETIDGVLIRSYVIPVLQEQPSAV